MKNINNVGVIGAGTMGSALAQKFAQEGFCVTLCDRESKFVNNGIEKIKNTLNEGVERRIFSIEQTEKILNNISGSTELSDLKKCDIVIEAIFENFDAKINLFKDLRDVLNPDTIVATNTSSYSVDELSNFISQPERFIGLHYFYHAAKNRLVEIIPGSKTSDEVIKSVQNFSILSGKDPIMCKDSYGFVVNRFFVPWLNEAVRLLDELTASTGEIDAICMKAFSISMGPFALMNATGVPIAYHAQKTLEKFGDFYKTSEFLKRQAEYNKPWDIDEADLKDISENVFKKVSERMLGVVFLVCSQILDEKICSAVEINRGARIGLRWRRGPIDLMKKAGKEKVAALINKFTNRYTIDLPASIDEKNWAMEYVKLEKFNENALITINRPEDMNALNEEIMQQLSEKFDLADNNPDIKRIFITGSGKAFVAGADIKFFIDNIKSKTLDNIITFTKFGQRVFNKIDNSNKTVISIVNGLTLGGGLELALCSDIILASPKAVFAFPETGIGIYPGLGGTQRTPVKIGSGLAKYLIYTGDFLNAAEAEKIGIVNAVIQPNEVMDIVTGVKEIPGIISGKRISDERYLTIEKFFNNFPVNELICGEAYKNNLPEALAEKLVKKLKQKAPVALNISEKLINEAKGCESELNFLAYIFSTSDALLGLSSVGKKVEFSGK
ncbi:MAG: 3-hydroxyacyl-CoA dehydrogenase/enoyl-CoA hydratase family protein [Ignavibacteriae bacterium]|nr:MAG: 3-hydroxyacyl-CoA dehydrogenase/enoyl-CoA hydratase family protein [Ignavibacteriota bacterium]